MKSTAERAYIYAKACGIVGKSFIGPRIQRLQEINRLSDLDRLLFPDSYQDFPERELLVSLEKRIIQRTTSQINILLKTQQTMPRFIELLIRSYEYADVKLLVTALLEKDSVPSSHADLGKFSTVHYEKYPDLHGLFANTDFEWIINNFPKNQNENMKLQSELDRKYYSLLWAELIRIKDPSIRYIREIISEEIVLKNILWALRLKFYFNFERKDIEPMLLNVQDGPNFLIKPALSCIDLPTDQFAPWNSFEYRSLLNPEEPGTYWHLNLPYVQRKAALLLYKKARVFFRRSPFSLNTAACFIKLKQFEEDLLVSLAEGISLGLSGREVLSMLEVLA